MSKDSVKDIIESTSNFLISHDKKELLELLDDFKEEEIYNELEELLDTYFDAKVVNNEPILEKFDALLRKSTMPTSKLLKFKILLDQIDRNRYRVHTILSRLATMKDAEDWKNVVELFAREDHVTISTNT